MDEARMTEDALLAALRDALESAEVPGGAITMREIRDRMGIGDIRAREIIRQLIADGRVESVRVPRQTIDLRVVPTPAYRLVDGTDP